MSKTEDLILAIKKTVGVSMQCITAEVVAVDEANYTIDAVPDGSKAAMLDIRIKAAIDKGVDGLVEIPEVGSTVLIGFINNDEDNAYLIKCSKVSKIIINGGELGGLVIVEKLVAKIEKLETAYNDLLTSCKSVSVALAPAGAFPLAPFFSSNMPIMPKTSKSDLENEKVKH